MKRKKTAILVLALLAVGLAQGQGDCPPQPLPWFEDFESGFVWDNGWINTTLDSSYFYYDHCWIHGFLHYPGYRSMISFEYLSVTPPVVRNNVLHIEKSYWDFYGTEPGLKYAVTPPFEASPTRVTFKAYYVLAMVQGPTIGDLAHDTVFPNGAMVAIGCINNEADPYGSFSPIDTVYVVSRDAHNKTFCCAEIDTTLPIPAKLQFRVVEPMDDWRGNIICYIDSIHVMRGDLPADTIVMHDTVCQGQPYSGHGFFIPDDTIAGEHIFERDSTANCQRFITKLILNVLPAATNDVYRTMMDGDTLRFGDSVITHPGTYLFHHTAMNGCDSTVILHVADCAPSVCVTVNRDFVDFDYPVLTLNNCTDSIVLSQWSFSDGYTLQGNRCRRKFFHPLPDTVSVTLTTCNAQNCCADTLLVFPLKVRSAWFPNTFTPSLDNNNRFGCVTSYEVKDFELHLYDRHGILVWQTSDVTEQWDGTRNGNPVPQGVYVFRWTLRDRNGDRQHGTGTVTLIR